ncbi:E3 ubiquitin-protein ligase RNF4 isoform X2 [Gopherus evgoodei]|uniref:E3 ubiquitin-protein ligase RNF4 isoform X2 n=1 Tax=Gopherus evgoodei TaxID=1825980 RepID=UPI0011CFE03E|nr:E3 ubiquitin-protein ligase RNF4 isoform X2 [Gopherus evgoodei]
MVSVPLTFFCILYSRNTMSTTQRKRRGGAINSRQTRKRNRLVASATEMASEAEPIELEESAGEEVVDLTCESSEPVVVDLTHNDSVVIVEENQRERNLGLRSQQQSDSCVLSSDDEDESRDNDVYVTNKVSGELGTLEDETASSRLFSTKLRSSERRARRAISPGRCNNGETLSGQMEPINACRLLLDSDKRCSI